MEIEFVGAAQSVTGSMHVVRTEHATVLLDCGLFQGRRRESFEVNRRLRVPAREISAVVLSHAHIDHSGALPMLGKNGFDGLVYATPATRDLAALMLRDAAAIQQADARYLNKQSVREGREDELVEPIYSEEDVLDVISRFVSVPYHRTIPIADGVRLTFFDAGHVLGSAITVLDLEERGKKRRLVFTGDLGRAGRPIIRDPEIPEGADILITESTYGDRLHDGVDKMEEDLARVVNRTIGRGGKVLIPSFALERAQEVIYALKRLRKDDKIPRVPVYVDSPLTVRITDVFKLHPECFDADARELLRGLDTPFDFADLEYVEDKERSKEIGGEGSAIIISASGMCEAGRILHHLKNGVEDPRNTVLIVGYQAQHTLGRRLVEQRARVRIFGVERERRADVVVLNGFSAHADQRDLVAYADGCRARGPAATIALVHGDPRPQRVLADKMRERGHDSILIPAPNDKLEIV
ncbi:MBL fold metallo-hydrolase [Polyangium spumosum]|uniref:MBL fold metallo-hydrolase n=1 Tax=Polyangium spumosum TaxID=889282 RepID=A0A6N7PN26_9BACT|nr:MBL fold metallo-hydrolase [Polyangium spumosum]MRG93562.1 MBL fold metallo-hydrolase [Polyangium spumosum]